MHTYKIYLLRDSIQNQNGPLEPKHYLTTRTLRGWYADSTRRNAASVPLWELTDGTENHWFEREQSQQIVWVVRLQQSVCCLTIIKYHMHNQTPLNKCHLERSLVLTRGTGNNGFERERSQKGMWVRGCDK